jgi:quinoprotein glucose dehydrogenase
MAIGIIRLMLQSSDFYRKRLKGWERRHPCRPILLFVAILSLNVCWPCGAAAALSEAEQAIKLFKVAPGLTVDLWAAEPMLVNPVAFSFDEKGRAYVCETFRLKAGVDDIREIMDWLDEELASRTVDDRLAEMKRHLGERFPRYSEKSERVRLLEDRDGDGKADHATVFADGFNTPLDGIGAGVLARAGSVWYANIPNLWLLRDTNQDGVADFRKSLHYGFGVRVGFIGHDLHGLHFGPDGRLYFSIGDRGSNLKLENGRTVGEPDTGCVFRCNADGSEIEVFATGLRNPQDLVFDEYGNLFTGDNNSDSGDKARWVHLVEGGDSGWRVGYQFLESPYSRGPFNEEKLWYPQFEGQAAYIVPPITNMASGPSGLAYFPGSGLPAQYKGHFFLVDFRGAGANSGVHTFTLKPKGASFELVAPQQFIWGVLPTDIKFGVDGGVYLTDWVSGWDMPGKGRIYRIHDVSLDKSKLVLETKKILAGGMENRSIDHLIAFLSHADMRVRQEAQFELAERGDKAIKPLLSVAGKKDHQLARLHAIWGLGQIAADRRIGHTVGANPMATILQGLHKLLQDADTEVRCQAAQILGEQRYLNAYKALIGLLTDPAPRARFFAAMSLGKMGSPEAIPAVLTMLRENRDKDPYLRHAGVMALSRLNDVPTILKAARDPSPAARRGVLLALRRLHRNEIVAFLQDPDPTIVLEAARAINDEPINGAMPELASLIHKSLSPGSDVAVSGEDKTSFIGIQEGEKIGEVPLLRRILNANFRLGTPEAAKALADFTARTDAPEKMRVEALEELASWEHPSGRDRVMGLWRPIAGTRQRETAADALQPLVASLLKSNPDSIRSAVLKAVKHLGIHWATPHVLEMVKDSTLSGRVRAEALQALAELNETQLKDALMVAQTDPNEELRKAATLLQGKLENGTQALVSTLERGTVGEKQAAFKALGGLKGSAADDILNRWLDDLMAAKVPRELQLDLLEAVKKRSTPLLKEKLLKYQAVKNSGNPLSDFSETLFGGQAEQGKTIFFERPEAQCVRCHKINGQGGDVGPDLTHIAGQKDRQFMLESIVLPNRQIAQGFESVMVTDKKGEVYAGVLKSENAEQLVLNSPERGLLTLKKSEIETRQKSLSPMPEGMGQILSKFDLRNLVEFLSTLK